MKILFLPHPYHGLYKTIEEELLSQGHEVTTLVDPLFRTYVWAKEKQPIRVRWRKFFTQKCHSLDKYWKKQFTIDKRLSQSYDLLFSIQGMSISPVLLQHLREINPQIKASLYIWDSNRLHDFFHNVPYFDKVFSFDWYDVSHDESGKVKFLPFFWPKFLTESNKEIFKYDISCVGSCHDGRLHVFKELTGQFDEKQVSYYFKLYVPDRRPVTWKDRLYIYRHKGMHEDEEYEKFLISKGLRAYPFVTHEWCSSEQTLQLMMESRAILDTDRELQFGTTPRLIWALACNKHVFTTNKRVKEFPFYNPDYIHLIDRECPKVDLSLISEGTAVNARDSVMHLRIDNWVKNFL